MKILKHIKSLSQITTSRLVVVVAMAICGSAIAADNINSPDVNASQLEVTDHVGDIKGDAASVQIVVRNADGDVLPGVAVRFTTDNRDAVITSINGRTNENGVFQTTLFSSVMGMYRVSASVDTDGDGNVDSELNTQSDLISIIDDLALSNGVGINIEEPDDSAVLHVFSTERGVMIPRVALQGCSDKLTILDPALSLLVFNTNASDTLDVGYVFFDGSDWKNFVFQ